MLLKSTTLHLGRWQKPAILKKVTFHHTGTSALNQHSPQVIIPVWITGMTTEAVTTSSETVFTSTSSK